MYDIILADPPWHFRTYTNFYTRGRGKNIHYKTMTLEDICKLPIQALAAENCALFIWGVWPSIWDVKTVMDAWGFKYRTQAWTWVKSNKRGAGFFSGQGYYTRANTEPCLLAVKGRMPVAVKNVQAVIYSPVRGHSQKPDEQYEKIERLYPGTRRLELFARKKWPGWDVWGDQVEDGIELE